MSWHYVVANINTAFKQMVDWYRIFMEKTESSFVALHERVLYLEQRQAWQGPSDEQGRLHLSVSVDLLALTQLSFLQLREYYANS
jgi:hypothetical protein